MDTSTCQTLSRSSKVARSRLRQYSGAPFVFWLFAAGLGIWMSDGAATAAKSDKAATLAGLLNPAVGSLIDSVFPPKTCSKPEYHPSMGLWTFPQESAPVADGAT
ncbi:MAG: hypothetical protein WCN98_10335, partial [Verrucomicrobiaceae bacterium]